MSALEVYNTALVCQILMNKLTVLEQYNRTIAPENHVAKYYMNDIIGLTELKITLARAIVAKGLERARYEVAGGAGGAS